jgi:hypothetical protein
VSTATNNQQPTTNNQSPITNHQPPTTNHQSPITNHQSPITTTTATTATTATTTGEKYLFHRWHPRRHQMAILQDHPRAIRLCLFNHTFGYTRKKREKKEETGVEKQEMSHSHRQS